MPGMTDAQYRMRGMLKCGNLLAREDAVVRYVNWMQSVTVLTVLIFSGCAAPGAQQPVASTLEPKPEAAKVGRSKSLKPKDTIDFVMSHNLKKDGSRNDDTFVETKDWVVAEYIGTGEVYTEGDTVYIGEGNDMTGITWKGPLPTMNYEISLDAKRVAGSDFFCGLTFPYNEDPCSLIVGGWGGRLVGISSLDYQDASENGTATYRDFATDVWYKIRLRVTPQKIEAWIDGDQVIDVETKGHKIGIRWEVEPSRPLGIATWRTGGAIRNVRLRAFAEGEA
jgi:hypothetical protein